MKAKREMLNSQSCDREFRTTHKQASDLHAHFTFCSHPSFLAHLIYVMGPKESRPSENLFLANEQKRVLSPGFIYASPGFFCFVLFFDLFFLSLRCSIWPSNFTLSNPPKKTKTYVYTKTCAPMFTAALFKIDQSMIMRFFQQRRHQ